MWHPRGAWDGAGGPRRRAARGWVQGPADSRGQSEPCLGAASPSSRYPPAMRSLLPDPPPPTPVLGAGSPRAARRGAHSWRGLLAPRSSLSCASVGRVRALRQACLRSPGKGRLRNGCKLSSSLGAVPSSSLCALHAPPAKCLLKETQQPCAGGDSGCWDRGRGARPGPARWSRAPRCAAPRTRHALSGLSRAHTARRCPQPWVLGTREAVAK